VKSLDRYFGQHYPSDVAVGALIGVLVAIAAMKLPLPGWLLDLPARLAARFPAPFYALAMLLALETATMFFETRSWMHRAGLAFHALTDTPTQIAAPEGPQVVPTSLEAARPGASPELR
jgi:membrane-associated phospholipid phosphatase